MTNIFYWHLVELSPLKNELLSRGIENPDLAEIVDHVEEIIHHRTLSLVFDNLPPEHHREFSLRLAKNPRDPEIWEFLHQKIKKDLSISIEENIRLVISEILSELDA
ncbi:hypothetical protein HZB78_01245 [Candidatus Collierbacteria bacterium]|nr:hypothetical protein [Candidatus Collierbacteria bacterium]